MDFWKQMDILHSYQKIMNPVTEAKIDGLISLLRLPWGSSVVDVACGKGELLFKLWEKYGIHGVGVDRSPYCIEACIRGMSSRAPESGLKFLLMDGASYRPERPSDLSCCVGASFVYGDHEKTLKAMSAMTRSGGLVLVGEPYWLREPDPEYLAAEKITRGSFRSHRENVKVGESLGLRCLYTLDGGHEGWDHYEALHWWAAEDYVAANPGDPDAAELLAASERYKETYLRWSRDTLGWCIYLFRKP